MLYWGKELVFVKLSVEPVEQKLFSVLFVAASQLDRAFERFRVSHAVPRQITPTRAVTTTGTTIIIIFEILSRFFTVISVTPRFSLLYFIRYCKAGC